MRRFSVILAKKSEVGGQRSAGARREDLLRAMYVGAAGAVLGEDSRQGKAAGQLSGGHVQELFGGGGEHCVCGGCQLSSLVGEVVAETVGQLPAPYAWALG